MKSIDSEIGDNERWTLRKESIKLLLKKHPNLEKITNSISSIEENNTIIGNIINNSNCKEIINQNNNTNLINLNEDDKNHFLNNENNLNCNSLSDNSSENFNHFCQYINDSFNFNL